MLRISTVMWLVVSQFPHQLQEAGRVRRLPAQSQRLHQQHHPGQDHPRHLRQASHPQPEMGGEVQAVSKRMTRQVPHPHPEMGGKVQAVIRQVRSLTLNPRWVEKFRLWVNAWHVRSSILNPRLVEKFRLWVNVWHVRSPILNPRWVEKFGLWLDTSGPSPSTRDKWRSCMICCTGKMWNEYHEISIARESILCVLYIIDQLVLKYDGYLFSFHTTKPRLSRDISHDWATTEPRHFTRLSHDISYDWATTFLRTLPRLSHYISHDWATTEPPHCTRLSYDWATTFHTTEPLDHWRPRIK